MTSRVFIPFDNRPVSQQRGTGTYTCPSGKFAKLTITVSGNAFSSWTIPGATNTFFNTNMGEFHQTFDIWVVAGDQVAATLSNASGTTSVGAGSGGSSSNSTTATVNLNSNSIAVFLARTAWSAYNGSGGAVNVSYSGSSNFTWYAQEYNVVT